MLLDFLFELVFCIWKCCCGWIVAHLYLQVVRGGLRPCVHVLSLSGVTSPCKCLIQSYSSRTVSGLAREDRHSPYRRLCLKFWSSKSLESGFGPLYFTPLFIFLDCSLARYKEDFITEAETLGNKPEDACADCFCPMT